MSSAIHKYWNSGASEAPRVSAPSRSILVRAKGVEKIYQTKRQGKIEALKGVSLAIHAGEFISIVGPSGCGKTTFLKILAGIIEPTRGELEWQGRPETPPGVVFQRPVLLPWRTVLENAVLPAQMLRLPLQKHYEKARELLAMMGLSGFELAYPSELSGGMQQRVAIVRALVCDPDLLLMDEPFGALDALTRDRLNVELQRISLETGKTIVFVTHSIPEAVFLGNRVLVMSRRPATIKGELFIDMARPRDIAALGTENLGGYVNTIRGMIDAED